MDIYKVNNRLFNAFYNLRVIEHQKRMPQTTNYLKQLKAKP
jgi:hypothetical protein